MCVNKIKIHNQTQNQLRNKNKNKANIGKLKQQINNLPHNKIAHVFTRKISQRENLNKN
jgi:hypothetical protein